MRNKHLVTAIAELAPNVGFSVDGDGNFIEWQSESARPTDTEIAAKITEIENRLPLQSLRRERDRRLFETDWWANSDRTMTAEQTAYRQALRDITNTYTSLDDVVWPTKPE